MREFDFVIGYEHKVREMESLCLLKLELEKRGYSVFVYYLDDKNFVYKINAIHCNVLILPFGYGNECVAESVRQAVRFDKIINLQWEQVLSREQEQNIDSPKTPKEACREAVHISWGEANVKRLVDFAGLPKERVIPCGDLVMDFLKPPFTKCYLSRKEVFEKFGLDPGKKTFLFISSFKAAFFSGKQLEAEIKAMGPNRLIQHEVMLESFNIIMEWVEDWLKNHPDELMIYRPHPGEETTWNDEVRGLMNRLQDTYSNFRVIGDYTVRQWILVSDTIIMGISTALTEVYAAGKSCAILYPKPLPEALTGIMMDNASYIRTKAEFDEMMDMEDYPFPIPEKDLFAYYGNLNEFAYPKVADVCEKVYNDQGFTISEEGHRAIYDFDIRDKSGIRRLAQIVYRRKWVKDLIDIWYRITFFRAKSKRKKREWAVREGRRNVEYVDDAYIRNLEDTYAKLLEEIN